jgi:hypothetical protein
VVSEVTLSKEGILNRSFLYSSSLQFSSIVDGDISTAMMGLSLGEIPANFQILDDKLRLVTDGSINFESDVNKPSRLIYEFPILKQEGDSLTIKVDRASPILDTFLYGKENDKVQVEYSFVRSMEYVEADRLIMIESTVELKGGTVGEFLESIRPREAVVPANVKPIFADAALNKNAERFRFLDAGDVYVNKTERERIKTKAAQRFLIKDGQPVKWYVTKNIPEAYLGDMKNAVEGWNRYFRAMGMGDMVRFEGRLPDGIKVGDPRYNLIVWDTVQDAGAAYESQNSDPASGIQSHSMIYIPYAWVNIGKDYWNKMSPENQDPGELKGQRITNILKKRTLLGRKLPVHCVDAPEMHLTLQAKEKPEEFARGLLKGVIFHEVGHAMGLAHNFKGSLNYDADDQKKIFTTSIMDYNHYNEEDAAFAGLDSSDGPLLEYDRQIISVLYNDGKDVKASDAEMPVCNDEEADSVAGGVDPLCVRYDIGSDVTKEAGRALQLFTVAGSKRGKMDAITPQKVVDALISLPPAAKIETLENVKEALVTGLNSVTGTLGIYMASSANSFGYLGSQSMRSLKVFQDDVLPEDYNENEMHERALALLEAALAMDEFPALTKTALAPAKPTIMAYLAGTPFIANFSQEQRPAVLEALGAIVDKLLTTTETALMSKMRSRFLTAVVSTPTAPLAFLQRKGKAVNVELAVMNLLEKTTSATAGKLDRPPTERLLALKVLKSYSRSEDYAPIAERVTQALKAEIRDSTDAKKKEISRILLSEFTKEEPKEVAEEKK